MTQEQRMEAIKAFAETFGANVEELKQFLNKETVFETSDAVQKMIEENYDDEYVKNNRLYRRFLPAKYMKLNDYFDFGGCVNVNERIRNLGAKYQFETLGDEIHRVAHVEAKRYKYTDDYNEMTCFFGHKEIEAILDDYKNQLELYFEHIKKTAEHLPKCKKQPYVKVKYMFSRGQHNVFLDDFEKKIMNPINSAIMILKSDFNQMCFYRSLDKDYSFLKRTLIMFDDLEVSKTWAEAYKKAGAYYTLKDMIIFNGLRIWTDTEKNNWRYKYGCGRYTKFEHKLLSRDESLKFIKDRVSTYEAYQFHALLRENYLASGLDFKVICRKHYND